MGPWISSSLMDTSSTVGDRFTIMTFGEMAGSFNDIKGTYGFYKDHYFEVVKTADKIELVTKELIEGELSLFDDIAAGAGDTLGKVLNADDLLSPTAFASLSGDINLGDAFSLSGDITFQLQSSDYSLKLSDGSTVQTDAWVAYGRDLTGKIGSTYGLSFSDIDFGFALFKAADNSDQRSWFVTEGDVGSASFLNLENLNFNSSNLSLDLSLGLGKDGSGNDNNLVVDLSATPITLSDGSGDIVTFDDDGSRGERISVAGSAEITAYSCFK